VSKKALGRGLDALINTDDTGKEEHPGIVEISVDQIDSAASQPRKHFSEESLKELAASIRENGVIQPIIVEKKDERYSVIAGERRLRSARLAGLEKIPAIIRDYPSERLLQIALIENIQREDLDPIEEALAYETLLKQTKLKQEELAERVGKSRSAVTNSLRLLKLPQQMQQALAEGTITPGHARALLSVTEPARREEIFSKIVESGLSVREAEHLAEGTSGEIAAGSGGEPSGGPAQTAGGGHSRTQSDKPKEPEIREIEQHLLELLGTKVELKGSLRNGRIEVSYYSAEDLERLLDLLSGGSYEGSV